MKENLFTTRMNFKKRDWENKILGHLGTVLILKLNLIYGRIHTYSRSLIAGLVAQLLNLLEVTKLEPARRPNFKDWVYWLPYIIGPIVQVKTAGYFFFP
jgi:hypothetical protein